MLYESLVAKRSHANQVAVIDEASGTTWESLVQQADELRHRLRGSGPLRIGVLMRPRAIVIATLAALDFHRHHAFLLDGSLDQAGQQQLVQQLQLDLCFDPASLNGSPELPAPRAPATDATRPHFAAESRVTILTSGTEGEPKAATHTWNSIARPVRRLDQPQTWLLAYRAHLYAGLQVILQSLLNGGTLVMPAATAPPEQIVRMMTEGQVQFASATPSYWRRLLMFADRKVLAQVPLQQITLGGEAVDQPVLDQLQDIFSGARIVHIYATTELGRCFSVVDGKAGFPLDYLTQPRRDAAELKIDAGQLFVRSPNCMLGYDGQEVRNEDDWRATGDLVEVVGDRVYFAGRIGDMINVGGNKVRPVAVERLLRTIEGVEDVRVYGQSSSVAGQLVACDIVPQPGYDTERLTRQIHQVARNGLAIHEVPRIVRIVDVIPTSSAGKVIRNQG